MTKYLIFICTILVSLTATAQTCRDNIPASTPDSRFTVSGDEVADKETGLVWQRCNLGQTDSDCAGYASYLAWQEALQAAEVEREVTGKQWRLPNIKELRSIVEEKCYDPAINLTIFPRTHTGLQHVYYWSASIKLIHSLSNAMRIDFLRGETGSHEKTEPSRVRLVRDAQ